MRVQVPLGVAELGRALVVAVAKMRGPGPALPAWLRSARAAPIAVVAALDFGASASAIVAWLRMSDASGKPIIATACAAATAVGSAVGSASPMSSLAEIISRRATKRGSSPATIIRAR